MGARTGPLPVQAMQTFAVDTPTATHWRKATCAEVDCGHYLNGWRTELDPVAQAQLVHTVRTSGRKPSAVYHEAGKVVFVYEAGTPCFAAASHRVRLDRPELFLVRPGDTRARTRSDWDSLGGVRQHTRPEHWVEEFRTNHDAILTRIAQG